MELTSEVFFFLAFESFKFFKRQLCHLKHFFSMEINIWLNLSFLVEKGMFTLYIPIESQIFDDTCRLFSISLMNIVVHLEHL